MITIKKINKPRLPRVIKVPPAKKDQPVINIRAPNPVNAGTA